MDRDHLAGLGADQEAGGAVATHAGRRPIDRRDCKSVTLRGGRVGKRQPNGQRLRRDDNAVGDHVAATARRTRQRRVYEAEQMLAGCGSRQGPVS